MSVDVYVYAAKGRHVDRDAIGFDGDEAGGHVDQVIAHGGHLNKPEWRDAVSGRLVAPGARNAILIDPGCLDLLGAPIKGLAGKHPADVLHALGGIWRALGPADRKRAWHALNDVQNACKHALRLERHPEHGVLYTDVRLVVISED